MKIGIIQKPIKELVIEYLNTHPGELFTTEELKHELKINIYHATNMRRMIGPEMSINFRGSWRFGSIASVKEAAKLEAHDKN